MYLLQKKTDRSAIIYNAMLPDAQSSSREVVIEESFLNSLTQQSSPSSPYGDNSAPLRVPSRSAYSPSSPSQRGHAAPGVSTSQSVLRGMSQTASHGRTFSHENSTRNTTQSVLRPDAGVSQSTADVVSRGGGGSPGSAVVPHIREEEGEWAKKPTIIRHERARGPHHGYSGSQASPPANSEYPPMNILPKLEREG